MVLNIFFVNVMPTMLDLINTDIYLSKLRNLISLFIYIFLIKKLVSQIL